MDRNDLKNKATLWVLGVIVAGFSLWAVFFPQSEFSESERRYLAAFPEISAESILSAGFMADFDAYTTDRFPLRDGMRAIKAMANRVLLMSDNGGIYYKDGHIGKILYPMNTDMLQYASDLFGRVYDVYIKGSGCRVYLSVIPDKNLYLTEGSGIPAIDYSAMQSNLAAGMPYAELIDIMGTLSLSSYYTTDTHWRQEALLPTAEALLSAMGAEFYEEFSAEVVTDDFSGVLKGQGALPHSPDSITLLLSESIENAAAYDYKGEAIPVYDLEKLSSLDPYEVYLSGVQPLIVIENPTAETDKELVIFRDSYGSSIAPLLLQGYSRVTLVDLRYMQSGAVGEYLQFRNQDVLFVISSLILDSANAMK